MSWSEDNLHRWLAEQPWPVGLAGARGHDAAVLQPLVGRPVVCADQCVEGVHFRPDADRGAAGAKAVLRTLSDLAATAATPTSVTLAVRAPESWSEVDLQRVILGARRAAVAHGAELVAGDLSMAPGPAGLTVTALGVLEGDGTPVARDRAVPGQDVVVTGPLGGSLASGRHLEPVPRLAEGRALVRAGATAMMDVSDGLALDLFRMARSSGVAIELEASAVPVHPDALGAAGGDARAALSHALHDGEDHELLACLPDGSPGASPGATWTRIGTVLEGAGLWIAAPSGRSQWEPGDGGWIHGGGPLG